MKRLSLRSLSHGTVALALAVLAAGCSSEKAPDTVTTTPARTLEVRGVVRQLPHSAGVPLLIEHEAIPDFVDIHGRTAPMDSMTMPFAVADDALLDGISTGNKIAFELLIDWQASPAIVISTLTRLPDETTLRLPGDDGSAPAVD